MKKQRCCKTALSGYYTCFSRDLLLMPSGADTHTHKHTPTFADETISQNQMRVAEGRAPGLKMVSIRILSNGGIKEGT